MSTTIAREEALPPPDADTWRIRVDGELYALVALTVNVDPGWLFDYMHAHRNAMDDHLANHPRIGELRRRTKIALAVLGKPGGIRLLQGIPYDAPGPTSLVRVDDFMAWFGTTGWPDLRHEQSVPQPHSTTSSARPPSGGALEAEASGSDTKPMTTLLVMLHAALKVAGIDYKQPTVAAKALRKVLDGEGVKIGQRMSTAG